MFPWRPTPDRIPAWEVVSARIPTFYPFYEVWTVDSGHDTFNRAATRNLAVEWAGSRGADVVVLNDADSIPEQGPLWEAIETAQDGLIHFPFDIVWYLQYKATMWLKVGHNLAQLRSRIIDKCESEGGVWVCTPEAWFKAGGMDDRLNGWGCDDRSFLAASRTLLGMPVKHQGVLCCLWHDRPPPEEVWVPSEVEVMINYQEAYLNPEKMRKVIDDRGDLETNRGIPRIQRL